MKIAENINVVFPQEKDIPSEYKLEQPVIQKQYLIDGQLLNWNGPMKEVYSPVYLSDSSQKYIGSCPNLIEKEALSALDAAVKAYNHGMGNWPTMSVIDRIKHVEQFVTLMKEKKSQVVKLLMWEIGKSYPDSEKEFDRTVEYIKDTIEALKDLDRISSRFVIEKGIIGQIRRAPLGVVLSMGPFNYPLNETFTTLIPALIMGNTVVFKPPKFGVMLYQPLLEAFRSSFPAGVVNTVYGEGRKIIGPLMATGKIDVLAFIGTSKAADILKKQHPQPHRLRCVLGLDAKNPAIILQDADIDLAVKECILGSLSFNGQRCTAIKMIYVHSKIAETFIEKLSQSVGNLKIGMPWESEVSITPLPESNKPEYLKQLVEDAQKFGAKVINKNGGNIDKSVFYPAILYPVNSNMKVFTEEQFGPIIPVIPFDSIDDPVNYVTESNYGQQVSIFGTDPDKIARLVDPLVNQVCRVNINSQCQRGPDSFPFTGRKDSAEGTLSVSDALRVFSIRTLVAAKDAEINKTIINKIVREHKSNFLSTDFIF